MNEGDQEVNGQLTSFDIDWKCIFRCIVGKMSKMRSLLTTEVCYNAKERGIRTSPQISSKFKFIYLKKIPSTLQTLTSGQTVITFSLFIFPTIRYQLGKVIRWVKWDESVCNGEGGIAIHRTIWSLNWRGPRGAWAESRREIRSIIP